MKNPSVIFCLLLAACATTPNQHADLPPDPGQSCVRSLVGDQEFAPIANKMAIGGVSAQTFEMLSATLRLDDTEKPIVAKWVAARQRCFSLTSQWAQQNEMPAILWAARAQEFTETMNLSADLYNGKITYGEFAQRRARAKDRAEADYNAEVDRMADRQSQRLQRAVQRALTPSTTTNCMVYGSQMRCETR